MSDSSAGGYPYDERFNRWFSIEIDGSRQDVKVVYKVLRPQTKGMRVASSSSRSSRLARVVEPGVDRRHQAMPSSPTNSEPPKPVGASHVLRWIIPEAPSHGVPAGRISFHLLVTPEARAEILTAYVEFPSGGRSGTPVRSQAFDSERVVADYDLLTGELRGVEVTGFVENPSQLPEWRREIKATKNVLLNVAVTTIMLWWERLLIATQIPALDAAALEALFSRPEASRPWFWPSSPPPTPTERANPWRQRDAELAAAGR
jgi:hypothetical protein